MPRYDSFAAAASRLSQVGDPVDGEPAGDPCHLCGVTPRYRKNDRGIWRIDMVHGSHKTTTTDVPNLEPPIRTHWTDDL